MKRLIISPMVIIICAIAILLSSCIYEEPGDEFYRTLWKVDEPPFGEMTLDFLCGNQIAINSENALFDDYGTYSASGITAIINDLFLIVDDRSYIIDQAVRDGDILYLHWHPGTSRTGNVTTMQRLSSYQ